MYLKCVEGFIARECVGYGTCGYHIEQGDYFELKYGYTKNNREYSFIQSNKRKHELIIVDQEQVLRYFIFISDDEIENDFDYSLEEAKTKCENYKRESITCANCSFCNGFIGSYNHPFLCNCLVTNRKYMFDKGRKCRCFKHVLW